jgi:hypothetical protein
MNRYDATCNSRIASFELRHGDNFSNDIAFAFLVDFDAQQESISHMFVSRKGTSSAIGVLSGGQLKIANSVNMQASSQPVGRYASEVKAHDAELDQIAKAVLALTRDGSM